MAQFGEVVRIFTTFSLFGVPTSGLSPAPTISVYAPDGTILVNAAAMTEQAARARYYYDYTFPSSGAGNYEFRAFTSANVDSQYKSVVIELERSLDGLTRDEAMRLIMATLLGKLSGAATSTIVIRAADDKIGRAHV